MKNIPTFLEKLRQSKYLEEHCADEINGIENEHPVEDSMDIMQSTVFSAMPPTSEEELERLVSEIGTGLWRIRQKLALVQAGPSVQEMRSTIRALESTWDRLVNLGIEVQDHGGETVSGGEAWKIIAFETNSGCVQEQVIETVQPTIFYKGKKVQNGEVIVGRPEPIKAEKTGPKEEV
ncbi:MAG: hypothetical protein ABFD04_00960 [Syntrophomonas sp.]